MWALILVATASFPGLVAAEEAIPEFDGTMPFVQIEDAQGPEEFTWRVSLGPDQGLEELSGQKARVFYISDGGDAVTIDVGQAHDANGATVPTSLHVTQPDLITLTVHHRDGSPESGSSFRYLVIAGSGWQLGTAEPQIIVPPGSSRSGGATAPPEQLMTDSRPIEKECGEIANPYPSTRYEGVPLSDIRARGVSCGVARRVARRAHYKALGLPLPAGGIRRFHWHGWSVKGDLRPASDVYSA